MWTKLIGLFLIIDGIGSWLQYRKQKVLEMKNGKLISLHWAHKLELSKLPKGKIKFIKQSFYEHAPRFMRAVIGIGLGAGLIILPVPF